MSGQNAKEWLTPEEAAEQCNVHVQTLYTWLRPGFRIAGTGQRVRLEAQRMGKRYRISQEAIEKFVAACNAAGGPETEPVQSADPCELADRRKAERDYARAYFARKRGGK